MSTSSHREQLTQLTVLWTEAQPSVLAFLRSVTSQLADAEDLLQETARQIAERFDEYDSARPFTPWAIGIARYKVLEWRRRQKKEAVLLDEEAIEAIHQSYADPVRSWHEVGRAIDGCIKKATPAMERLLVMRYFDNLRPAQIARRLGSTANSVSVRLSRARDVLRNCLRKELKEVEA